jgi:hypothetical protein
MFGAFDACCVYRVGDAVESFSHRTRCFERGLSVVCGGILDDPKMTKAAKTTNASARWEWAVYTPIVLSMMAAVAVLLAQGIIWLKTSKWHWIKLPDVGIHFPLERLVTEFLGGDKALMWLSNEVPLFLWLVLIIPLTWRMITAIAESILPIR